MKRNKTHLTQSQMLGTAVATATIFGCSVSPQNLQADPRPDFVNSGIYVNILTPSTQDNDGTKQLEISAFYQAAASTGGVTTFQLYVDGRQQAVQNLTTPDMRGVVSFRLSPGALTPGQHHFVITVSAADAEVASAKTDLTIDQPEQQQSFSNPGTSGDSNQATAPAVAIISPQPNATVQGTVNIKVDAHDDSGTAPYVSLFIDHTFKTLRNYPPFDFAWDTTLVQNGLHTIEVWGYNDDQAVGHAEPLTVYVDNPGGRTTVRHDLLDTVPQKVLIGSLEAPTLRDTLPEAQIRPTQKLLATNETPISVKDVHLASTQGSSAEEKDLSAQTLLMAPFLHGNSSVVMPSAVQEPAKVAPVTELPALAEGKPAAFAVSESSNSAEARETPLTGTVLTVPDIIDHADSTRQAPQTAAAPTVNASVVVRPALSTSGSKTHTLTLVLENLRVAHSETITPSLETPAVGAAAPTVELQPTTQPKNAMLASSNIVKSPFVTCETRMTSFNDDHSPLFAQTTTLSTPPINVNAAAVKNPAQIAVSSRALLAMTQIDKNHDTYGETRMVSAPVGSSTLFVSDATLTPPSIGLQAVAQTAVAGSGVIVLGQSSAGFPLHRIFQGRNASEVVMNDRVVTLEQPMQNHDNFLFTPLRQIFESEGGEISWNAINHQIHALSASRDVLLTVGSKIAIVDEQPFPMESSPYISGGVTMVPLAFVPIALDAKVSFDPTTGHLMINSN